MTKLRDCHCQSPSVSPDPRNHDPVSRRSYCLRCSGYIRPECIASDETFNEFFTRLRESLFDHKLLSGPGPPAWYLAFENHCRQGAREGQDKFGLAYLTRSNSREGQEEGRDGGVYAWLHILQQRQQGEDEEWALALTAAYHAAKLHEAMVHLETRSHRAFSDAAQEADEKAA